ncbi:hypothetical protein BRARA_A02589 [Brassica rapa]|uniref:Uncharacterized protein n=1 Tax=Brassica campestris TaxID=3711 RepID=A0A398AQ96_BRACM|nr:hypothetical protein BRARA_A02589 [Brassica rapa]
MVAVVVDLLGVNADLDWEMALNWLVEHNYNKLTFILLRLVFQTSIYYLWNERNDRRHTGKNRIMSTRYFEKPMLLGLLQRWFRGN